MSESTPDTSYFRVSAAFEEFDALIAGMDGRTVPTGRQVRPYVIDNLCIGDVCLQVSQEGGSNFYEAAVDADRVGVYIGLPAPNHIYVNGVRLNENQLLVTQPGKAVRSHTSGVTRYAGLTLPVERFIEVIQGIDPARTEPFMSESGNIEITTAQSRRIVRLLRRTMALATEDQSLPTLRAQGTAVHELIRAVIESAVPTPSKPKILGRPRIPRQRILARVDEYLDSSLRLSYSVAEMAAYAQVSERTLREVVRAHYGLTPKSLVMLGQLRDIREALRRARPRETISSIAARRGVWDWGRFAQRYRSVYGESPSETVANHSATF